MPILAPYKNCTGCFACKDACKSNAIYINYRNSVPLPFIDEKKCVNCHKCENACSILRPVTKNHVTNMQVFGGWAKDDDVRKASASGGAFSALAISFLRQYPNNSCVVGASLVDGLYVKHIIVNQVDDLDQLRNSKYIESETDGIYRKVKDELLLGKHVLFSGTPCIIAGLYGFLGGDKFNSLLTTIDLVCHGNNIPETLSVALQTAKAERIVIFRDKLGGQAKGQTSTFMINGVEIRSQRENDPFYKLMAGGLMSRPSCGNCKYSSIDRIGDVTLADFWGDSKFSEKDKLKGISLIISNNTRGLELIKGSEEHLHVEHRTLLDALQSNANLYSGRNHLMYHPVARHRDLFRKILPNRIWMSIIRNDKPWKFIWGVYRLITKIYEKNMYKKLVRMYCK